MQIVGFRIFGPSSSSGDSLETLIDQEGWFLECLHLIVFEETEWDLLQERQRSVRIAIPSTAM
jgi:N-methylhydantoinase B/oxoprolinase/acetone carboxylase alpha subunit